MSHPRPVIVEIVRDFLLAHQHTRHIAERFRSGRLRFEEVRALVGDDEESCLYRLKERCHRLFRPADGGAGVTMQREALFDLAVGSLFHEAMKFRENFYQREAYAPRVRALRSEAAPEAVALFDEFEKILSASLMRVEEALQEMEALLVQTRLQFRELLRSYAADGLAARYLVAHAEDVTHVFPDGLDALLAEIHGDAARGWALAARSYLDSGFFDEAIGALTGALARDGAQATWHRWRAYALGMAAYLQGSYEEAVESLGEWVEAGPAPDESAFAGLALSALASIEPLCESAGQEHLVPAATALCERLRPLAPEPG